MVILILTVVGLCLGSFINAFIWRFHSLENGDTTLTKNQLSIAKGRSMCVHCHHELAPKDLIPVVSFLRLRGKCRYCQKPIPDTPIPELVTPLLFVGSYLFWPAALQGSGLVGFAGWLFFLIGLVALALYDIRWYELPHRIVLPLIAAATALAVILSLDDRQPGRLGWIALGGLVGGGLFMLLYLISPKQTLDDGSKISAWIGGGDITLGVLLGILVGGPGQALLVIFVASLLGTLVALPLLVSHRASRGSHLPFGPYLILAAIVVKLFGAAIIGWYSGMLIV